jgi:hypothetical protein
MEKSKTLQNKLLFYLILVLAIANVIQFWFMSDVMSIGLFVVTGLITSVFVSKNMTVIILISIIIANIFKNTSIEGFKRKSGIGKKSKGKQKENKKADTAEQTVDAEEEADAAEEDAEEDAEDE